MYVIPQSLQNMICYYLDLGCEWDKDIINQYFKMNEKEWCNHFRYNSGTSTMIMDDGTTLFHTIHKPLMTHYNNKFILQEWYQFGQIGRSSKLNHPARISQSTKKDGITFQEWANNGCRTRQDRSLPTMTIEGPRASKKLLYLRGPIFSHLMPNSNIETFVKQLHRTDGPAYICFYQNVLCSTDSYIHGKLIKGSN